MAYERVNWENLPSTKTPINQTNLNKMENGIDQAGAEIFVGTEEPTAGEKVWFNKDKNSIYVRNSNGVYEEFVKAEDWKNLNEDYGCYYRMIGKQVFIRAVSKKNITLKASTTNIIGILPDKYKPAYQIRFNPYSKGYSTTYCEINTNGVVYLFNWNAEKTFEQGQIAFYINYYVD